METIGSDDPYNTQDPLESQGSLPSPSLPSRSASGSTRSIPSPASSGQGSFSSTNGSGQGSAAGWNERPNKVKY